MNNKGGLRNIISTGISVILSCLFTGIFLLLGLYYGYFNQGKILRDFKESNYFEKSYEYISSRITEYSDQLQVPAENLLSVITYQKYYSNQYDYVYNEVKHIAKIPKVAASLKEDLYLAIQDYDTNHGIVRDETMQAEVDVLVTQMAEEYQDIIELKLIDYINFYQEKIMSSMILVICIMIICILGFAIWLLCMYRRKYRAIRFIIYALLASLGLTVYVNQKLLTLSKGYVEGLSPDFYKNFIEVYFHNGYTSATTFGILISGIFIIMMFIIIRLMKKPIQRERGDT